MDLQDSTAPFMTQATPGTFSALVLERYVELSSTVLFLWDYFITFGDEIRYVWQEEHSTATWIFVANRYVNLTISVLEILEQTHQQTLLSCEIFTRCLQTLIIVSALIIGAFAFLRVYAISGFDYRAAALAVLSMTVATVIGIVTAISQLPLTAPPPFVGCAMLSRFRPDVYNGLLITSRVVLTVFEGLVILITLARTMETRRHASKIQVKTQLMDVLSNHGVCYFLALIIVNISQLTTSLLFPGSNYTAFYITPLSSILVSRFLLDLRRVSRPYPTQLDDTESSWSVELRWAASSLAVDMDIDAASRAMNSALSDGDVVGTSRR